LNETGQKGVELYSQSPLFWLKTNTRSHCQFKPEPLIFASFYSAHTVMSFTAPPFCVCKIFASPLATRSSVLNCKQRIEHFVTKTGFMQFFCQAGLKAAF